MSSAAIVIGALRVKNYFGLKCLKRDLAGHKKKKKMKPVVIMLFERM